MPTNKSVIVSSYQKKKNGWPPGLELGISCKGLTIVNLVIKITRFLRYLLIEGVNPVLSSFCAHWVLHAHVKIMVRSSSQSSNNYIILYFQGTDTPSRKKNCPKSTSYSCVPLCRPYSQLSSVAHWKASFSGMATGRLPILQFWTNREKVVMYICARGHALSRNRKHCKCMAFLYKHTSKCQNFNVCIKNPASSFLYAH